MKAIPKNRSSKAIGFTVWLALLLSFSAPAIAQDQEPEIREGYNTPIPGSIMTPDTVKTKYLGTLKFTDGRPAKETADKLYDHLAYLRAIEVFLN